MEVETSDEMLVKLVEDELDDEAKAAEEGVEEMLAEVDGELKLDSDELDTKDEAKLDRGVEPTSVEVKVEAGELGKEGDTASDDVGVTAEDDGRLTGGEDARPRAFNGIEKCGPTEMVLSRKTQRGDSDTSACKLDAKAVSRRTFLLEYIARHGGGSGGQDERQEDIADCGFHRDVKQRGGGETSRASATRPRDEGVKVQPRLRRSWSRSSERRMGGKEMGRLLSCPLSSNSSTSGTGLLSPPAPCRAIAGR